MLTIAGLWALAVAAALLFAHWAGYPAHLHGAAIGTEPAWSGFIKYDPLMRLPEFLAGIVLCRLFLQLSVRWSGWGPLFYWPGLACIVLVTAQSQHLSLYALHNGLLLPASAAVLLGLGLGGGWFAAWLSTKPLTLLGRASYALYLLHMPVYAYFAAAGKRFAHTALEADAVVTLYLLAVLTVSVLCHLWIEEPARRWILRRVGRQAAARAETPVLAAEPM